MNDDLATSRRQPFRSTELADRWGVSPQAIVAAIKSGKLDGFRFQRLWLVKPESVQRVERGEAPVARHKEIESSYAHEHAHTQQIPTTEVGKPAHRQRAGRKATPGRRRHTTEPVLPRTSLK